MNFFEWYGIGVATIVLALFHEIYSDNRNIKRALKELYEILVDKADILSTTILLLVALLGPLLPAAFAYFMTRSWYDSLPVDDDDNKDFPWTKE